MQRITPFLWFDGQAEEAANFYCSVFKNSKVKQITHYTGEEPSEEGRGDAVSFELDGEEFVALNGGPQFKFPRRSVRDQLRDAGGDRYYWEKLTAGGGEEVQCGWLADNRSLLQWCRRSFSTNGSRILLITASDGGLMKMRA